MSLERPDSNPPIEAANTHITEGLFDKDQAKEVAAQRVPDLTPPAREALLTASVTQDSIMRKFDILVNAGHGDIAKQLIKHFV